MSDKTRRRELARAAAKREADKRAARHRVTGLKVAILTLAAVAVAGGIALALTGGSRSESAASATPSPPPPPPPTSVPEATLMGKDLRGFPCEIADRVKMKAKAPPQQPAPPAFPVPRYTVALDTSCGRMTMRLLPEEAPLAVASFISLAGQGWFDGVVFHRVANDIDIIQTGDPNCSVGSPVCGSGGPGYDFDDELYGDERYVPGTVAMANSGPNTNGSQFFIVTGPKGASLPPSYTVFGELVGESSMETARRIQGVPLDKGSSTPATPVWIEKVGVKTTE